MKNGKWLIILPLVALGGFLAYKLIQKYLTPEWTATVETWSNATDQERIDYAAQWGIKFDPTKGWYHPNVAGGVGSYEAGIVGANFSWQAEYDYVNLLSQGLSPDIAIPAPTEPPPTEPSPTEPPPTGPDIPGMIATAQEYALSNFPGARRLYAGEAMAMEVIAGWVECGWGRTPAGMFGGYGITAAHVIILDNDYQIRTQSVEFPVSNYVQDYTEGILFRTCLNPYMGSENDSPKRGISTYNTSDKMSFIGTVEAYGESRNPTNENQAKLDRARLYAKVVDSAAPVVLFEHSYYRGHWIGLWESAPSLSPYEFNDLTSSVWINGTWKVRLWEHDNYTGWWADISGDKPDLYLAVNTWADATNMPLYSGLPHASHFNDILSSVEMSPA